MKIETWPKNSGRRREDIRSLFSGIRFDELGGDFLNVCAMNEVKAAEIEMVFAAPAALPTKLPTDIQLCGNRDISTL